MILEDLQHEDLKAVKEWYNLSFDKQGKSYRGFGVYSSEGKAKALVDTIEPNLNKFAGYYFEYLCGTRLTKLTYSYTIQMPK